MCKKKSQLKHKLERISPIDDRPSAILLDNLKKNVTSFKIFPQRNTYLINQTFNYSQMCL